MLNVPWRFGLLRSGSSFRMLPFILVQLTPVRYTDLNGDSTIELLPSVPLSILKPPEPALPGDAPVQPLSNTLTPVQVKQPSANLSRSSADLTVEQPKDRYGMGRLIIFAMILAVAALGIEGWIRRLEPIAAVESTMVDYSLATTGARVIGTLTTGANGTQSHEAPTTGVFRPPIVALSPDNSPGLCWAFRGMPGQLAIQLSHTIRMRGVTLYHPPSIILPDPTSAPRIFTVWGLVDKAPDFPLGYQALIAGPHVGSPYTGPWTGIHLGSFEYNREASPAQSFGLSKATAGLGLLVAGVIVRFDSNWGNPEMTCVYKVSIYGTPK